MHYKCFFSVCVWERLVENKRWWATAEPAIGQVIFTSHCPRLIRLFTVYSVPPLSPAFTTTVPSIYWSTHNDSIYLADLGLLEVLFNFRYRPSANFTSLSGPCRQMTHGGALITDSLSLYLWNSIINTQENKKRTSRANIVVFVHLVGFPALFSFFKCSCQNIDVLYANNV